jgi:hypothetical protein
MFSSLGALRTSVVVGALLITALSAAPAQAAGDTFRDAANDAPARVDVRSVHVAHTMEVLRVRVGVDDYRRNRDRSLDSVYAYIDTNRSRRGPEHVASIEGFNWYFLPVRNWRTQPSPDRDDPFTSGCRGMRADFDLRRDYVVFTLPRTKRCIGRPRNARISAAAAHPRDPQWSRFVIDHAPARHRFYRWLHRG